MNSLETARLTIRNWEDRDRDLFHRINSDEDVMRFFPFRRTRTQADAFLAQIRQQNAIRGYGFSALERRDTRQTIGFVGLHPTSIVPARPAGSIEIGWRLVPEAWGHGYVTEAAEAVMAFGFEKLNLDEIVSFAVYANEKSIAVMQRIGMRHVPADDFDHPLVPDTHPHLKRHVFYVLEQDAWRRRKAAG